MCCLLLDSLHIVLLSPIIEVVSSTHVCVSVIRNILTVGFLGAISSQQDIFIVVLLRLQQLLFVQLALRCLWSCYVNSVVRWLVHSSYWVIRISKLVRVLHHHLLLVLVVTVKAIAICFCWRNSSYLLILVNIFQFRIIWIFYWSGRQLHIVFQNLHRPSNIWLLTQHLLPLRNIIRVALQQVSIVRLI